MADMQSTVPRAGRFVMANIQGMQLDAPQADFLRTHGIRAVCLFRGNIADEAQVRRLTRDLRAALGEEALIAVDQEGGSVIRATFLPQAPAAMSLGAADDTALAGQVGAAVARGLRSLGMNWNFAPVLDVNNNPANPVIAERSFGQDPALVARLAGAWMQGALREGVACCVKHFPGHGDTHVDSHHALPVVDKSLDELRALELVPFAALRDRSPAIMTAHIVYPQLDSGHPATLSARVLGGLLRGQMAYDGVVITDSLVMKAIHERYGHDRAAVLALQAGADMVMALGSRQEQAAAVAALQQAIDDGRVPAAGLLRSAGRLDALARRYPVQWHPYDAAERAADAALMLQAWSRGLVALDGARAPAADTPLRVITQRAVPSDGVSEAGPSEAEVLAMFRGFAGVQCLAVDELAALDWAAVPRDSRFNVLVSNDHVRYGPRARAWRPDLHLVLWNPFQALDVRAPALVSWGYAQPALEAVQQWLAGRLVATGVAPVPLRPVIA